MRLHTKDRVTLANLGKFDDLLGDDFVGEIAAVCHPQGYASRFERETQNPLGFAIDVEGV
jgi:hypothetical protein